MLYNLCKVISEIDREGGRNSILVIKRNQRGSILVSAFSLDVDVKRRYCISVCSKYDHGKHACIRCTAIVVLIAWFQYSNSNTLMRECVCVGAGRLVGSNLYLAPNQMIFLSLIKSKVCYLTYRSLTRGYTTSD